MGAEDGQTISVNLETTNSSTLGVASFDVRNMLSSTSFSAVSEIELDGAVVDNRTLSAVNTFTPGTGAVGSNITADGVFQVDASATTAVGSDFAVRCSKMTPLVKALMVHL